MLGQEAALAQEQWQHVKWENLPTGRQSVPAKPRCSGDTAWWLPALSGLCSASHSPALCPSCPTRSAIVPWSSVNHTKSRVPMCPASLQPLHHHVFILRISCLPFHSLLLQHLVLFHLRKSSTTWHSQMQFEWCLTVPLSRDTSPAAGPCTQQTRPQLPVSHARQWLLLPRPGWFSASPFC